MSTLSVDELILEPAVYSGVRKTRRAEAIDLRRARRVRLGALVVLEFESVATLSYQAQEMLFVERVTDRNAAAAEIASYARLQPTARSVAATMLLELSDPDTIQDRLTRLDGLHDAIWLEVGSLVCPARDIPPPDEGPSDRTVSVHFLGFELSTEAIAALRSGEPARLVTEHPAYQATAELSTELVALLVQDIDAASA